MQSVIVYYRAKPAEQRWSDIALAEQRAAVTTWLRDNPATVLAEETEAETDGGSRPRLKAATDACKTSGATLLIARTEAIGSGLPFQPRIVSINVAFAPATPREIGHRIIVPSLGREDQLSLYFPDFGTMRETPVYLCNASSRDLSDVWVTKQGDLSIGLSEIDPAIPFRSPSATPAAHLEIGDLASGEGVLIDAYHPMIDSDFTLLYQMRFNNEAGEAGRKRAVIGTSGPDARFITMRG